jgi:RNA 3'-terminal phosphate cyclase (ATP)
LCNVVLGDSIVRQMAAGTVTHPVRLDGSQRSGSGTIVRFATAFACLLRRPLHLFNARAKREKPGLRPQHLAAVRACAELCGGTTEGLTVGAREFTVAPGARIPGGAFSWDIGTAGSATMLALGILPVACFAERTVTARITGGVFQDWAPSPHHMQHVLAPLLARMGATMELRLLRPGYVPRGGGVIELRVEPRHKALRPLTLIAQGSVRSVRGIALSSHLAERQVSERMARTCEAELAAAGVASTVERVLDTLANHPGASLAVWAETSTGCLLGADRVGAQRRTSEAIGHFVASRLLADLAAGGTVDQHAADQLVLFAALAGGVSRYVTPARSDHLETNLWLAQQFGAQVRCERRQVEVEGIGFQRSAA